MKFVETWKRRREKKYRILYKSGPSTLALIFAGVALALWGMFAILSSYPVGLTCTIACSKTSEILRKVLQETSKQLSNVSTSQQTNVETKTPTEITKDVSLPEGHYVTIPKIGVDTVIWEGEDGNYEKALKKGVWRVNDFGFPAETLAKDGRKPMILAAHRFGYLEWTQEYRLRNSFYKLPDLEQDDEVEIVWDQMRYKYKVTN